MIENFEKLEFNRKVDILVAIYVMGRLGKLVERVNINEKWYDEITWLEIAESEEDPYPGTRVGQMPKRYSTYIEAAWDIVRKFDYLYLFKGGEKWNGGKWECKLVLDDEDTRLYGWAETEQLAICYAGLKAVGFDVQTFLQEEGKI